MQEFGSPIHSPRGSADLTGIFGSPFVTSLPNSPIMPETPRQPPSPIDYPMGSPNRERSGSIPGTPGTPGTPSTPGGSFRRGHGRQSSLGTTMTSPSTRRRSLESTVSMIREAMEGSGSPGLVFENLPSSTLSLFLKQNWGTGREYC